MAGLKEGIVPVRNIISKLSFAFLFIGISQPVSAQQLEPSGPWKLDYGETECRLVREFGTGDGAVALRIARGATLDTYDIIIAGNKLPYGTTASEITLTALPLNLTTEVKASPYALKASKLRIWRWFDLEASFIESLNDQQTLTFTGQRKLDLKLRTPGLAKGIQALKTCHEDLLKTVFKIDLAALNALSKLPEPDGRAAWWITTDDYPRAAMSANQTGTTQFSLVIDSSGKPQSCNILVSSGFALLDQTTCKLIMARAKFKPAEDKNGQPVSGLWLGTVRWMMPR